MDDLPASMVPVARELVVEVCSFIQEVHCEENPSFMGQAPEPIDKNLNEFSNLIKEKGNIAAGLATDGDADRIGLYNSKGEYVDSHHIILLILLYLNKSKKL